MFVWTLTTAFNGVYQPLLWLKNVSGSPMEQYLVWMLLVLSIAGMAGNVSLKYPLMPAVGERTQSVSLFLEMLISSGLLPLRCEQPVICSTF